MTEAERYDLENRCIRAIAARLPAPMLRRVAIDLFITPPRGASVDAGEPYCLVEEVAAQFDRHQPATPVSEPHSASQGKPLNQE